MIGRPLLSNHVSRLMLFRRACCREGNAWLSESGELDRMRSKQLNRELEYYQEKIATNSLQVGLYFWFNQ
jgi:hypothetical protein